MKKTIQDISIVFEDVNKSRSINNLYKVGIYVLYYKNRIVYIGQSTNIHRRLIQHLKSNKLFDKYNYIEIEVDQLDDIEEALIRKYKPIHNTTHNDTIKKDKIDRVMLSTAELNSLLSSIKDIMDGFRVMKTLGKFKYIKTNDSIELKNIRDLFKLYRDDKSKYNERQVIAAIKHYIKRYPYHKR